MRDLVLEVEGDVRVIPLGAGRSRIEVCRKKTPVFLTKQDMSKRFGVSPRTIENWTKAAVNPLPVIRGAGHPRFDEAEVTAWLLKKKPTI